MNNWVVLTKRLRAKQVTFKMYNILQYSVVFIHSPLCSIYINAINKGTSVRHKINKHSSSTTSKLHLAEHNYYTFTAATSTNSSKQAYKHAFTLLPYRYKYNSDFYLNIVFYLPLDFVKLSPN